MSSLPTPNDYAELRALMDSGLVKEILHTNNPPENVNRTILATALKKHRAHLASLNETIEELKARLATMTTSSAQFSSGVHTLETILHPIRSLPCEVIGRICEHALEDFAIYPFDNPHSPIIADSLSMRHPSWTFSHVCRKWRSAILGHSRCWSHVVLSLHKVGNSLRLSVLFSDVLEYAGKAGLSTRIDSPKGIPSDFMTGILRSCYLWREAQLCLTSWDYKALSDTRHSFGALKTLSASISDVWFPGSEIIDIFAAAPQLHTFVMTKTSYSVFQLSRVTDFVYQGINPLSATRAREELLGAPALTSANIVLQGLDTLFHSIPTIPAFKSAHHAMKTLNLSDAATCRVGSDSCVTSFLKSMRCPCLTELRLDMRSLLPLDGYFEGGVVGPSIRTLAVRLQDASFGSRLCNLLSCSVSLEHLVLHVNDRLNLEFFIRDVQETLTALPIETLTFSSDASIAFLEFDDCSHVANLCSALRKKGVLRMVSIQPVTYT